MLRLPSRPGWWTGSFLLWFVVLWFLSGSPPPAAPGVGIPHLDKVAHFGYFFGGAGLAHAAVFTRRAPVSRRARHLAILLLLAGIGALDEWHQSWTPERSGNDFGDWAADVLGAFAGGWAFDRFRPLFRR